MIAWVSDNIGGIAMFTGFLVCVALWSETFSRWP